MATCKDCIHVEVCRYYTNELAKANGIPLKVEEIEGLLECGDCEHFKGRSRFVELPLKVGDTFYTFNYDEDAVSEQIVDEIRIIDDIEGDNIVFYGQCVIFTLNEIGSFAFLTKSEAEQTLKERERIE